MINPDLAWAAEEACLNAWPSPRQVVWDRWLLRAAGGPSRRINSVNPLRAVSYDPGAVIEVAAPLYAALGRPLIVRVPALADGLGDMLERRGFSAQHRTRTLFTPLDGATIRGDVAVEVAGAPSAEWLALRKSLNGGDAAADHAVRAALDALMLPRAFVSLHGPDGLAAIAFGAIHRGLLVVEAVGTDPPVRGKGHARRVVAALMAWAARQGTTGACLQALEHNAPAIRLYEKLGFRTDLYDYAYWARERIP